MEVWLQGVGVSGLSTALKTGFSATPAPAQVRLTDLENMADMCARQSLSRV